MDTSPKVPMNPVEFTYLNPPWEGKKIFNKKVGPKKPVINGAVTTMNGLKAKVTGVISPL